MSRSVERVIAKDGSVNQKSRYEGMVTQRGNRVYVVEHEMVRDGSVVETILTPSHRQQARFLRGMTIGVAWRPHASPYSSRSIWKRIESQTTVREALKACGAYSTESRDIDPTIRTFFKDDGKSNGPSEQKNVLV